MEKSSLSVQIQDTFAQGDNKKLQEVIGNALNTQRDKTVETLAAMLRNSEGKLRLKVLEVLSLDGGPDLIPLFVEAIRKEKVELFAKSQILLVRDFKHQEALPALLSLENEIQPKLKATYQSALGKMLSQFSEQFYMSEFRSGAGNRRRVKFAVDMMLRSPHPDYPPFLNEQILLNDMGFRVGGVRALKELGNKDSIDSMFALLSKLRTQYKKAMRLDRVLAKTGEPVNMLLKSLAQAGDVNWSQADFETHEANIARGDAVDALEQLIETYDLPGEIRKKIKPYLKEMFSGQTPAAFEVSRVQQTFQEFLEELHNLLHDTAAAMGQIALRIDDESTLERLEAYLPEDETFHQSLLVAYYSGYQCELSLTRLREMVDSTEDPKILDPILDALASYELEGIPVGVMRLCSNEKHGLLRKKALKIVGKSGQGQSHIATLINNQSIAVRTDAIACAAEFKLEECLPVIRDLLKKEDLADSVLNACLEAMRSFPGDDCLEMVKPFVFPPYTQSLRKTALETIVTAGGDQRMQAAVKLFEADSAGKLSDLREDFLKMLLQSDWEKQTAAMLSAKDFLLDLLSAEEARIRKMGLQIIESLELPTKPDATSWLMGLKKATECFKGNKISEDEQRLRQLIEAIESVQKRQLQQERQKKTMGGLVATLKSGNPVNIAQALGNIMVSYNPEHMQDNPELLRKMINSLTPIFERQDMDRELQLKLVNLVSKVRHPKLMAKLRHWLEHRDVAIRNAAHEVLALKVDPSFVKPIKTIFIMDDSRYITKQLSKILGENKFEVYCENDVTRGLSQLASNSFDLLILDFYMPGMNGMEFLEESRNREIAPERTLVITSSRNKDELTQFVMAGVDGLMLKPFRMDELLNKIRNIGG